MPLMTGNLIQVIVKIIRMKIKPFNVIDYSPLPEMEVDILPEGGDPVEIDGEIYFVCDTNINELDKQAIEVIPLVVKNPTGVENIHDYVKCLTIAQRRIQFRKANNICDIYDCDEMVIS